MNEPASAAPGPGASELKRRVVSALVLAAAVLAVTLWGGWPFRLVWVLVAGIVAYEWLSIVSRANAVAAGAGVAVAGLALALLPLSSAAVVGVTAAAALLGALSAPFVRGRLPLELCGVAYALAFAIITPALRDWPVAGLALILWSFAVVWLTDIAAYFTGRRLGGPKLMPRVSPKKTWSGAIGGTLAGTVAGALIWSWAATGGFGVNGRVLAASLAASVASQAGDLYESALKRRFGTKDSSGLIPGHGGFLDRLDGYWAVLVLAGLALFAFHIEL
ncbi:phosphatidate cytidylyltransferase [Bosea sp. (in: a-proteobacteria)]|uniref:phosphatidate cytidylyltransferase n=1 Tax=Bosea sp. (in: a-proteobacteria) TaxID=1871050 RepID=UPI001AC724C1|nr:phosphatidate cytidylyltransferase [Bosea sp. (in: a-proteobacteria)]MBN9443131.1 phosphatidate cytidylyltransferase [Bosea sp. (in: a-proteobacteria)]